MLKQTINTESAPKPIGPYSQAIKCSDLIFVSGQIPVDPNTGKLVEEIEAQARQCLDNISAILTAAGSDLRKVIKTTIFLKDLNDFKTVNEIYGSYFTNTYPARSTIEAARLPLDAKVEIEAIAAL
ncbi:MAG: endoribonuclease L-PSP [Peptococcaceae bacterium BRH_c4a]|nr:MAG: endoribonuclease L-PSP [Peptococcaceae bacterium BRH_c4a]